MELELVGMVGYASRRSRGFTGRSAWIYVPRRVFVGRAGFDHQLRDRFGGHVAVVVGSSCDGAGCGPYDGEGLEGCG